MIAAVRHFCANFLTLSGFTARLRAGADLIFRQKRSTRMSNGAKAVPVDGGFGPSEPAPGTQDEHEHVCEGSMEGTFNGTVRLEGCCCKLRTETQIIDTGPMSVPDVVNVLATTTQAYESQGYLVLAHSLTDAGGTWLIGLTVGMYD